jgi:hypothetical protein
MKGIVLTMQVLAGHDAGDSAHGGLLQAAADFSRGGKNMTELYELCTGPKVSMGFSFPTQFFVNYVHIGTAQRVHALGEFLKLKGVEIDHQKLEDGHLLAALAVETVAIGVHIAEPFTDVEKGEEFVDCHLSILRRARAALGVANGGTYTPFAHVIVGDASYWSVRFHRVRGLRISSFVDRSPVNTPQEVLSALQDDDRLAFLIELYETACDQERPEQRILHFFMCLESISAGINRYLTRSLGGNQAKHTRDAIRLATRYGYGDNFPWFEICDERQLQVDHILMANKLRDNLVHGGQLCPKDLPVGARQALPLLNQRPEMFALVLAWDCVRLLRDWTQGSTCRASWYGEPFELPQKGPGNPARNFHILSTGKSSQPVIGAWIRNFRLEDVVLEYFASYGCSVAEVSGIELTRFPLGYKLDLHTC